MAGITQWLELNGFNRASTVREAGDYAVRGGIVDLFAPGMEEPVRLDFFGDTLELIRSFDPETQRTTVEMRALDLVPMAEFQLTTDTIRLFRTGYVAAFGAAGPDDVLYEAVSEGRRYAGMEHWLPLFHPRLDTLFDYLDGSAARSSSRWPKKPRTSGWRRSPTITRRARTTLDQAGGGAPYKPLPPDRLYLAEAEWRERLDKSALARLSPFAAPRGRRAGRDRDRRPRRPQFRRRTQRARRQRVRRGDASTSRRCRAAGKRVVIALWSDGSRERMAHVLAEHGLFNLAPGRLRGRRRWRCPRTRSRSPCSASKPASRPPMSRSSPRKTFSASAWCARAGSPSARRISSPR